MTYLGLKLLYRMIKTIQIKFIHIYMINISSKQICFLNWIFLKHMIKVINRFGIPIKMFIFNVYMYYTACLRDSHIHFPKVSGIMPPEIENQDIWYKSQSFLEKFHEKLKITKETAKLILVLSTRIMLLVFALN